MTRRVVVAALLVGVVGCAGASGLTVVSGNQAAFFRGYLVAYTFWLGLALGSLGLALIQFLTGGNWGLAVRRIAESAALTLPLLAILFVPNVFGASYLYAWARPADVAADPVLLYKSAYLNVPFFTIRAFAYLAAWTVLAILLNRWSATILRVQRFSIFAVLLLALTTTFAAIDWLMSLDADWYSTMYPPMVGAGFLLSALALATVLVALLGPRSSLGNALTPSLYNDLGSLLLAFLMLWAYMSYFQYLLIWAGNLSDEIPWYLRRVDGAWRPVALVVGGLGFGVPFCALLIRPLKRNPRTLATIAALLLLMHVVDVYWLIEPPLAPAGPSLDLTSVMAFIGIGGLWSAVFAWQLGRQPLLAPADPRLTDALEAARGTA